MNAEVPVERVPIPHLEFLTYSPERTMEAEISQALAIGQSFDVYGSVSMTSLREPLFDFGSMPKHTIDYLGTDIEVPIIINWIGDTSTLIIEGYGENLTAFMDKMSRSLDISTHIGFFSGEAQATFATSSSRSAEQSYAYKKYYSRLGMFQYQPGYEQYLTPWLKEALAQLPDEVNEQNFVEFEELFNRFGVYFVTRAFAGANLNYGATLTTSARMSAQDISAAAHASYNALFAGVTIDAQFAQSQAWQSYQANAQVSISTRGGDPALAAQLTGADPFNPNTPVTTGAFVDWVQSANLDPANVFFGLSGIWELAGAKHDVVKKAWAIYGPRIQPVMNLTSTAFTQPPNDPPRRPSLQVNGSLVHVPPAPEDMGLDVVIFNGTNLLAPPLFKKQFGMNSALWSEEYPAFWNRVAREITASGFATSPNLLALASYNFEWDAPPTSDAADVLLSAGAARLLPDWVNNCDPGSSHGDFLWRANILFAGFFDGPRGSAVEVYDAAGFPAPPDPLATLLTIVFNAQPSGAPYVVTHVETVR